MFPYLPTWSALRRGAVSGAATARGRVVATIRPIRPTARIVIGVWFVGRRRFRRVSVRVSVADRSVIVGVSVTVGIEGSSIGLPLAFLPAAARFTRKTRRSGSAAPTRTGRNSPRARPTARSRLPADGRLFTKPRTYRNRFQNRSSPCSRHPVRTTRSQTWKRPSHRRSPVGSNCRCRCPCRT